MPKLDAQFIIGIQWQFGEAYQILKAILYHLHELLISINEWLNPSQMSGEKASKEHG